MRCVHAHIYHCIIHNAQDMETTQIPIIGWMNKNEVGYIYNGILFNHEKGGYPYDSMDGPWEYYTKRNRSDGERQVVYDITYMWNLKQLNL